MRFIVAPFLLLCTGIVAVHASPATPSIAFMQIQPLITALKAGCATNSTALVCNGQHVRAILEQNLFGNFGSKRLNSRQLARYRSLVELGDWQANAAQFVNGVSDCAIHEFAGQAFKTVMGPCLGSIASELYSWSDDFETDYENGDQGGEEDSYMAMEQSIIDIAFDCLTVPMKGNPFYLGWKALKVIVWQGGSIIADLGRIGKAVYNGDWYSAGYYTCDIVARTWNAVLKNATLANQAVAQRATTPFHYGSVPLVHENPPASWVCDPANYGTGDGCDCECGASDPDCIGGERPWIWNCASSTATCVRGHCSYPNVPAAWRCSAAFFGSNDGCDCNCGAFDPDCRDVRSAVNNATVLNCPCGGMHCSAGGICVGSCNGATVAVIH